MRFPPCSTSMRTVFAPASSAFSSSSFTTDAGRSTTSPAAILFATPSASIRMRDINLSCQPLSFGAYQKSQTRISFGSFFALLDRETEVIELRGVNFAGRVRHQILRRGRFGEGDDFANGFFACQEHDDAINAQRDAAMRRRAVGQRIEEKPEAAPQLLLAQAERFEKPL